MTDPTDQTELEEAFEERMRAKEAAGNALEHRIMNTPLEWRGPLVDVLDTFEVAVMKMVAITGRFCTGESVELCRLILQQKALADAKASREEGADADA